MITFCKVRDAPAGVGCSDFCIKPNGYIEIGYGFVILALADINRPPTGVGLNKLRTKTDGFAIAVDSHAKLVLLPGLIAHIACCHCLGLSAPQ